LKNNLSVINSIAYAQNQSKEK
jgi:hypothetical protein